MPKQINVDFPVRVTGRDKADNLNLDRIKALPSTVSTDGSVCESIKRLRHSQHRP